MRYVWDLINSPAGLAVIGAIASWFGVKFVKGNKRAEKLVDLWQKAFEAAEGLGVISNIPGSDKWTKALEMVSKQLAANGMPPLSQNEIAAGKESAYQFGLIRKLVKAK